MKLNNYINLTLRNLISNKTETNFSSAAIIGSSQHKDHTSRRKQIIQCFDTGEARVESSDVLYKKEYKSQSPYTKSL
jgi:hypothetical protein